MFQLQSFKGLFLVVATAPLSLIGAVGALLAFGQPFGFVAMLGVLSLAGMTDEGATFRDLLVEARQELGRKLLSDPSAAINEVAFLLGYQDTSSFYRAFKDWEGITPNRWRELKGDELRV